jgi:hypothetical protein
MKNEIEKLGFKFDHQLKNVDTKLEELKEITPSPTKDEFINFLNESTEWNLCDCCGKVDNSTDLRWVGGSGYEEFYDEEYHAQRFIIAYTCNEALCDDCFDDFKELTFLNLETVKSRLAENGHIFRAGEKVFVDLSYKDKYDELAKTEKISNKVFTIKCLTNKEGYQIENSSVVLKDDMLFDMINFALCNEFAIVVDKHTDRIDEYDELNSINHEGQLDITHAFKEYGLKKEFEDYLVKNNYEDFVKYL